MRRISWLFPLLLLGACREDATAPGSTTDAIVPTAATAPVVACEVHPLLSGYDVIVVWQRMPTTRVSLRAEGVSSEQPLAKRTRNGGLRVQLSFIPTNAFLFARTKLSGSASCTFISS
ncbi:MAG TPA: hypothetical protein VJQ44_09430 [Gemmatimonadales bacterium]|nr:hypothetical protein [Gemmatimonadales bacterium]